MPDKGLGWHLGCKVSHKRSNFGCSKSNRCLQGIMLFKLTQILPPQPATRSLPKRSKALIDKKLLSISLCSHDSVIATKSTRFIASNAVKVTSHLQRPKNRFFFL